MIRLGGQRLCVPLPIRVAGLELAGRAGRLGLGFDQAFIEWIAGRIVNPLAKGTTRGLRLSFGFAFWIRPVSSSTAASISRCFW
jgi:hypothetical protein